MAQFNLLMVGCGNMGSALLSGWLDAELPKRVVIVRPSMAAQIAVQGNPAVAFVSTAEQIPADFAPDMIILAVKPQILGEVLTTYKHYVPTVPFLSMAAGKTLDFFTPYLGNDVALIRVMPNLPVTVARGVIGCVANANVTPAQRAIATTLMEKVGSAHWIDESQMDALTAVSGSGPAYVFLLQEALAQAGEKLGLDAELSAALARETLIGTALLLDGTMEDPALLRQRVTSKGGVTEAALAVLQRDNGLADLMAEAVAANAQKAKELAR